MKNKILIFLLAIYIFLMIIVQIDVYTIHLTFLIVFLSLIISVLASYIIFYFLDKLYSKIVFDGKPFKSNILVFIFTFLLIFIFFQFFLKIIYPGYVFGDAYDQYTSAYNNVNYGNKINNWFPVISTIIMYKIPMLIFNNTKFTTITFIQQFLLSLALAYLCYKLNKNNANKFVIILTLLSIILNINILIIYTSNVRDVMLSSVIITLFAKMIDLYNKNYCIKIIDFVIYILLIVFILLFRYNSLFSVLFLIIVLICKFKKKVMKILFIPIIIFLIFFINIYTNSLSDGEYYAKEETFLNFYSLWLQVYKEKKTFLEKDFKEIVLSIASEDIIQKCYKTLDEMSEYDKNEIIYFRDNGINYKNNTSCFKFNEKTDWLVLNSLSTYDIIKYTLYSIKVSPESFIYMLSKNIDFAVAFSSSDIINYTEFNREKYYDEFGVDYGLEFKPLNTKLYNKFLSILSFFQNHDLIYAIFGSIGIRMLIYVVLCVYFIKKDWHKSLISLPFILYVFPTMICDQDRNYRYYLFVVMLSIPTIWLYFHNSKVINQKKKGDTI